MDRARLQQHLVDAEQHVADGAQHITKQESLIAQLDRDGHDTMEAKKVLDTLRRTQALLVERRNHILRELAQ